MSDLIRPNLQNTFNRDSISHKEPEIFKYFGKYKNDDGIREFEKDLEKGRKGYKSKDLDL